MTRFARTFFVLLLTALWLPVQGLALLVMPLSMLASTAAVATDVTTPEQHAASADGPCHEQGRAADEECSSACQHCSLCQHGCSGYTAQNSAAGQWLAAHPVLQSGAVSKLTSQIPEPLDHPPRHTH